MYYRKMCLRNISYGNKISKTNKSSLAQSSYHHLTASYSNKNEIICGEFSNALVELRLDISKFRNIFFISS